MVFIINIIRKIITELKVKNKEILIHKGLKKSFFKINRKKQNYCTRVNFRLKPKLVLEVGNVFATNGLFIV